MPTSPLYSIRPRSVSYPPSVTDTHKFHPFLNPPLTLESLKLAPIGDVPRPVPFPKMTCPISLHSPVVG